MLKASKHEADSKIRSRQRAVEDYDVDRPQVQAWRHVQPSGTNCPISSVEEERSHGKQETGYKKRDTGNRKRETSDNIKNKKKKGSYDTSMKGLGA